VRLSSQTRHAQSPVTALFGGALRSLLRREGVKGRATIEPFHTLSLDVRDPTVRTVDDALRAFMRQERLRDVREVHVIAVDLMRRFGKRLVQVSASKQMSLAKLPPVLIVHLKRFVYGTRGPEKSVV